LIEAPDPQNVLTVAPLAELSPPSDVHRTPYMTSYIGWIAHARLGCYFLTLSK